MLDAFYLDCLGLRWNDVCTVILWGLVKDSLNISAEDTVTRLQQGSEAFHKIIATHDCTPL